MKHRNGISERASDPLPQAARAARARRHTIGWYVTAGALLTISVWPTTHVHPLLAPRTPEQRAAARELRERAQSLSERGELGEAIVYAIRADELDPDDAR